MTPHGPSPDGNGQAHALRVLLVEDNDGDAALIDASFAGACTGSAIKPFIDLARARSLGEAMGIIAGAPCDVVLLDLGLPDSNGIETLRALRAACALPIVVLTGLRDENLSLLAIQRGAQDYLVKGDVSADVMLRSLRYARERKQSEDELARARWLAGVGETTMAVLHEINNPLAALLMSAELLASGERDPALVEGIVASAKRLAAVTQQLGAQRDPVAVNVAGGIRMLDLTVGA